MPLAEELVALQKQGPSNVGAYVKIGVDLAFSLEQYYGALVPDDLVHLASFTSDSAAISASKRTKLCSRLTLGLQDFAARGFD